MKILGNLKKYILLVTVGLTVIGIISGMLYSKIQADSVSSLNESQLKLDVKSAIAIDAKTGQVLYAKNAEQPVPVASMSKLVTAYLVMQAVKEGKLSWNQKISIDSASQKVSQDTSLSNVPLKEGNRYTVKSLFQAMLIYSANGAAMALGHQVAGSHKAFIDQMRTLVKSWGINDAKIYTANGLSNGEVQEAAYPNASKNAENEFSAKDMAIISQKLINDYPEVLETTKITKINFDNGTSQTQMDNWNWMLKGLAKSFTKLPVDGLKTGTSDAAGACFAATVHKDNHRIITIVLGANHTSDVDTSRFDQTQKLMSYVYNHYTYVTIPTNYQFKGAKTVSVPNGKQTSLAISTKNAKNIWLDNGLSVQDLTVKVTLNKNVENDKHTGLQAPIKKGQIVGKYTVNTKQQKLLFVSGKSEVTIKAKTDKADDKANIFVRVWRWVKNLF